MDQNTLSQIEMKTRGQSDKSEWFQFRKSVITGSKGHDVFVKMKKLKKLDGRCIDMYSLNEKISGRIFTSPDIPALRYGRVMEPEAIDNLKHEFGKNHIGVVVSPRGLFIDHTTPYIGASPDGIVTCSCCANKKWCLEVKCPYSINFTSPLSPDVNLTYLTKHNGSLSLNENHRYFIQCQMQMGVTNIDSTLFYVWTAHVFSMQEIPFDTQLWTNLKEDFITYYKTFYLGSFFAT